MNEQALQRERDRLRLLLEITNSMTSKLDLRRLIEGLSTNLLRVTRCDFCSLLLPDADSGELRMTILYKPEPRGYVCGGIIPIHGSVSDIRREFVSASRGPLFLAVNLPKAEQVTSGHHDWIARHPFGTSFVEETLK